MGGEAWCGEGEGEREVGMATECTLFSLFGIMMCILEV